MTTCSAHAPMPAGEPVTVSVNGVAIARDAIVREMQHHPAPKPIAAWQQAARALVIRELLLQEVRRLGVAPQPASDGEGRRETDEEAMMRGLIDREVTVPEPDDETCRRYYERNSARFRSPDIYAAAHILFAALSVGGAGRQSRPDHGRANDARVRAGAHRAQARSAIRGAGRNPLRLPCHPARSQACGPDTAL